MAFPLGKMETNAAGWIVSTLFDGFGVHWHGAASDSGFTHIAINTKVHLGATQWYEPVTNEEYDNYKE